MRTEPTVREVKCRFPFIFDLVVDRRNGGFAEGEEDGGLVVRFGDGLAAYEVGCDLEAGGREGDVCGRGWRGGRR